MRTREGLIHLLEQTVAGIESGKVVGYTTDCAFCADSVIDKPGLRSHNCENCALVEIVDRLDLHTGPPSQPIPKYICMNIGLSHDGPDGPKVVYLCDVDLDEEREFANSLVSNWCKETIVQLRQELEV
jgi:hypothetical protein